MTSMKNSDLIADICKIWNDRAKNIHKDVEFGFRGNHSNWGNNWSMNRKTSVMRVTKPLR